MGPGRKMVRRHGRNLISSRSGATSGSRTTRAGSRQTRREILHIRDSSLYMPRDLDISTYFEIVKPTIVQGFDYTALHWADKQKPLQGGSRRIRDLSRNDRIAAACS